jgi:hypothetical protein
MVAVIGLVHRTVAALLRRRCCRAQAVIAIDPADDKLEMAHSDRARRRVNAATPMRWSRSGRSVLASSSPSNSPARSPRLNWPARDRRGGCSHRRSAAVISRLCRCRQSACLSCERTLKGKPVAALPLTTFRCAPARRTRDNPTAEAWQLAGPQPGFDQLQENKTGPAES